MLPKAELHVHLEGTLTPSMIRKIAKRNDLPIPEEIFGPNETILSKDFFDFIRVYDIACEVLRTGQDFEEITYDYLSRIASQGAIYAELTASPDHATNLGVSHEEHMQGIARGIDRARDDFGIEARILLTCVRHLGVDSAMQVLAEHKNYSHPYVVGINMAGNEVDCPPPQDFLPFYQGAIDCGLQCTAHAGEHRGADCVMETITHLPVTRIGHGVRSIEDQEVIKKIIEKNIILEVCPNSNIYTKVYDNLDQHPLNKLLEQNVKLCLNSDDPPFFNTNLQKEYDTAKNHFGLDNTVLLQFTKNAIEASFVDETTKQKLLNRLL